MTSKARLVKHLLTFSLVGVAVFYIGYHHAPEDHGYKKEDIAALDRFLSDRQDAADVFGEQLPVREK